MNRVRLVQVPKAFALLARPLEVETDEGVFEFRRQSWLAADPDGGALLIGPDAHALETEPGDKMTPEAVRLRGRFVGRPAEEIAWKLNRLPLEWDEIGTAESVLYLSDKLNGGGTGKPELFRHDFSPGAMAYRSGEYLAIVGPRITVDAAGIRN